MTGLPDSILTVTTPRTDEGRLVTLDDLKAELSITSTESDDYYNGLLLRVSQSVEQYCSRTFAVEAVSEVWRYAGCGWPTAIMPRRRHVVEVAQIEIDGTALDVDGFEFEAASDADAEASIYRLSGDSRMAWSGSKITIAYTAGYETTPGPVRQAVFELVKLNQASRTRDPALRSENILDGLYSYTLFNGENLKSVLDGVTGLSDYVVRRMVW